MIIDVVFPQHVAPIARIKAALADLIRARVLGPSYLRGS